MNSSSSDAAMLKNAIEAIELGVEDFVNGADQRRAASAVRNFFAGVLLLLKEVLFRLDPLLVAGKVAPTRDQDGHLQWTARGRGTVDVTDIMDRWKSLKLQPIEWKKLERLRDIRNDVEHRATAESPQTLREVIADTFQLVSQIAAVHLKQSPASLFDEGTWEIMLAEASVHADLVAACEQSRTVAGSKLRERLKNVVVNQLACIRCGSELIKVTNEGGQYSELETECQACGEVDDACNLVAAWAETQTDEDAYRVTEGGSPSWGQCPNCHNPAYSLEDDQCLVCEQSRDYDRCYNCGTNLGLDEQDMGGLCGYCSHMAGRDD